MVRKKRQYNLRILAVGVLCLAGCGGEVTPPMDGSIDAGRDGGGTPQQTLPSTFTSIASAEFELPMDAVASADGSTFYFSAFTLDGAPAIFSVPSAGGTAPTVRFSGAPLEYPSGLALSCDGATLFVADPAAARIFAVNTGDTTAPRAVDLGDFGIANAIGTGADCNTLVIAGETNNGTPAVMRAPTGGGTATILAMGFMLTSLTGVVDGPQGDVWVLDHLGSGMGGQGVLWRINSAGMVSEVTSGLLLGTPGGISLSGDSAVVGTRGPEGEAQLSVVNLGSGAITAIALPNGFQHTAGLRVARTSNTYAIVDSEGAAIYRGE
jgi:hypothetical protein